MDAIMYVCTLQALKSRMVSPHRRSVVSVHVHSRLFSQPNKNCIVWIESTPET